MVYDSIQFPLFSQHYRNTWFEYKKSIRAIPVILAIKIADGYFYTFDPGILNSINRGYDREDNLGMFLSWRRPTCRIGVNECILT